MPSGLPARSWAKRVLTEYDAIKFNIVYPAGTSFAFPSHEDLATQKTINLHDNLIFMNEEIKRKSILTSFFIGAPIGLLTVFIGALFLFAFPILLTGEGILPMVIFGLYGKAVIGLIVSFLFALWYAGKNLYLDISKDRALLFVSFKYSLTVNAIIWSTFIIITVLDTLHEFNWFFIVPAIFAFLGCLLFSTFTLGLLISYIIRQQILESRRTATRQFSLPSELPARS